MDSPPDMDHIENLIQSAVFLEVNSTKNPYLTLETFILRLYRKIAEQTRVQPYQNERSVLFEKWHEEILETYLNDRSNLSHDEKICVERVLSKDAPHASELLKFACCWYKYHPAKACKMFAVDGLLGTHPKFYVQDAFSTHYEKHNVAVRELYAYFSNPETIKEIIEKVLSIEADEPSAPNLDPDFETCVRMYSRMVTKEERALIVAERKSKIQQHQAMKRKKGVTLVSPP